MSKEKSELGKVLSVPEAATKIGVHFATIYRWIEDDKIIWFEFGGTTFIPQTEVVRQIKLQKEKSKS